MVENEDVKRLTPTIHKGFSHSPHLRSYEEMVRHLMEGYANRRVTTKVIFTIPRYIQLADLKSLQNGENLYVKAM